MALFLMFSIIAAISAFFYLLAQYQDGDLTLLYYSKCGKSPRAQLAGKVVWISGASSGLGEYIAYELAKNGARLVLSARRKERLQQVKEKCIELGKKRDSAFSGKEVLVLPMDTTDYSAHRKLTQQVLQHFQKIDILINNAGRSQRGWAINTPLDVDQAMLDLNVIGPISHTKAVLPHMLERGQGMISVVSSAFGKYVFPYESSYCASKFALLGYYDTLRLELQDKNIKVLVSCPGPVKSEVAKNAFTETLGMSYGEHPHFDDNVSMRMDTERFAELMVVGLANELEEVWISKHPQMAFMYLNQHVPAILSWYSKRYFMAFMRKVYNMSHS